MAHGVEHLNKKHEISIFHAMRFALCPMPFGSGLMKG
jgi:hypothetical protein